MIKPLQDRIALITGASRASALPSLARSRAQAHMSLPSRAPFGGLEELDDAITRRAAVRRCAGRSRRSRRLARLGAALNERYGKVRRARRQCRRARAASPLGHIEPKQWTDVMTTNVTANSS